MEHEQLNTEAIGRLFFAEKTQLSLAVGGIDVASMQPADRDVATKLFALGAIVAHNAHRTGELKA